MDLKKNILNYIKLWNLNIISIIFYKILEYNLDIYPDKE